MTNAARALFLGFSFLHFFFSLLPVVIAVLDVGPTLSLRDPAICDLVEDLGLGLRVGGQPAWNWLTLGESAPGSGSRLLRLGLGSWLHRKDLGIQVHFMQVRKGILGLGDGLHGLIGGFLGPPAALDNGKAIVGGRGLIGCLGLGPAGAVFVKGHEVPGSQVLLAGRLVFVAGVVLGNRDRQDGHG